MPFLIRIYQLLISPILHSLLHAIDNGCRFSPTCSHYALICYQKYNPFKATAKTIWRLLRCAPWSKGGVDLP